MHRLLVFTVLVLSSTVSFAHDHKQTQKTIVQTILHDFHAALSSGEHKDGIKDSLKKLMTIQGLKEWAHAFNIKRTFRNAYSYYKENRFNPATKEHIANLVFIFPLSHTAEILFGPIASSISFGVGWPVSVTAGLATFGTIISIPGLDPVCILILSTYKFKIVQDIITALRKGTVTLAGFIATKTGVVYLYEKIAPIIRETLFRKPEEEQILICSSIFAI